uniref:TNF receptor-associated factor n=1 Tax=Sinocyclocheilus rhinocerous TaxID=307959 RepID=A0A673MEW5_9TELE
MLKTKEEHETELHLSMQFTYLSLCHCDFSRFPWPQRRTSASILTNRTLRFVLRLEQQFVCPSCGGIVLNPHQTGCGHIFCARENGGSSKCPLDNIPIKPEEIFQDNCCKRELLNLEIYCTNAPDCTQRVTLCDLQDHLKACQYERIGCSNVGCNDTVLRKNLLDHQRNVCSFRQESCHHCRQPFPASQLLVRTLPSLNTACSHLRCALHIYAFLFISLPNTWICRVLVIQQFVCTSELAVCSVFVWQRSVEEQRVRICSVQRELRDLRGVLGSELSEELPSLRAPLDSLRQQVAVTESLREHLGKSKQTCQRHTRLLDIHVEQLQFNEQRFHQLESTSYDGKLIWKVRDYWHRKEAGTLLNSTPLYTSRSGYKLSVRAYLGGENSGRGTHLSLYITIMRGDFDSLLPWPFRQNITLTLLDQSGSRNHQSNTFTPDTNSDSFHRPTSDSNVATGFPRFISHGDLEAPRNAVYVRDDTLFIKVKVDTTGLEDL